MEQQVALQWNSPPWNVAADYSGLLRATAGAGRGAPASPAGVPVPPGGGRGNAGPIPGFEMRRYATLAEYSKATHQDEHSVLVDYDIFENLQGPDGTKRHAVYHAMDLNFRLKPGSKGVDAAVRLPTINDDFTGRAPDLGAIEVGKPEPVYGPRPGVKQPFYR